MDAERARFIEMALENRVNRAILGRGPDLGVPDWWLVAGAVFQTVWNVSDGRDPCAGIRDYDLFYFDASDLSWEAEDAVIQRAASLFADLDTVIETYAPSGYADLFDQRVRPNPVLANREVYERKVARWLAEWPGLVVDPWPDEHPGQSSAGRPSQDYSTS